MNNSLVLKTTIRGIGMAALLLLGMVSYVKADGNVVTAMDMPTSLTGIIDMVDCNNSGGPQVTLDGNLALGGLKLRLILQNNSKGTHQTSVLFSTDIAIIDEGDSIVIPKQPVRGGVGGNPHIWLQLHDGMGADLSEEIYLGRCVQGLVITADVLNQILAAANIQVAECRNNTGPVVTISGDILLSGLKARFIFRNNLKGTHTAEETANVTIIEPGTSVVIPKQPVRGGVGGNPIISIQFLHGDGTPAGDPVVLGRCVKLCD